MKIKSPIVFDKQKVTSHYGYRKIKGIKKYHYGVDLIGEKHGITEIRNCFFGKARVIRSYHSMTGGNSIVLEYWSGQHRFVALYCHLAKRYVKEGQYVEEDQLIGLMGNTGISFGAHLHFQLHIDKTSKQNLITAFKNIGNLNPLDYITQ